MAARPPKIRLRSLADQVIFLLSTPRVPSSVIDALTICECLHCGRADEPGNLVPFGVGPHAWLHSECWRGWYGARMAEAAQALRAIDSGR